MKIVKISDVAVTDNPHKVDSRKIYDHESAQAVHITLQPGTGLKPHITPVDVFFYILEGTVTVLVGEERIAVECDSLVESPKNIVHSLYNETDKVTRILVVKAPKPTAPTKF
jgi:quercetin dioxygenase-like cupin family protein